MVEQEGMDEIIHTDYEQLADTRTRMEEVVRYILDFKNLILEYLFSSFLALTCFIFYLI